MRPRDRWLFLGSLVATIVSILLAQAFRGPLGLLFLVIGLMSGGYALALALVKSKRAPGGM